MKEYWKAVGNKVVENLTSLKMWIIIGVMIVSTTLLVKGFVNGGDWVTMNTTLIAVLGGMREAYKVAKIKAIALHAPESDSAGDKKVNIINNIQA